MTLVSTENQVRDLLKQDPTLLPSAIAEQLKLTEAQVVFAFDKQVTTHVAGEQAEIILTILAGWGKVTTIVHSLGSIFEVLAPFPKGKNARGYYNLQGDANQFHGHLRLDLITDIALVSKPFRGSESHYFGFFTATGKSMFKVYLGRDEKRQLFTDQVEKFKQLKVQYGAIER